MRPPPLVLTMSHLPPELAAAGAASPVWTEFRAKLASFAATGAASFARAGVALDIATVATLAPGDLVGLVVEIHDRRLARRIIHAAHHAP